MRDIKIIEAIENIREASWKAGRYEKKEMTNSELVDTLRDMYNKANNGTKSKIPRAFGFKYYEQIKDKITAHALSNIVFRYDSFYEGEIQKGMDLRKLLIEETR